MTAGFLQSCQNLLRYFPKNCVSQGLTVEKIRIKIHETSKVKVLKNGYHSSSIVTAVLWSLDKGSFPHKDKPVGWILF